MKTFSVEIIADSVNPEGNRLTTMLTTYPRFIHSELMTHRVFSRNAASSRAIPIEKVLKQVDENPAMPVRWGTNGKGMQDHGALQGKDAEKAKSAWILASDDARVAAMDLMEIGLHKQIVNRVLEPFVWMTTLISATEWENFFSLRVHKDAQPEFQHLSYLMLKAYLAGKPVERSWGDWHIPYGDRMPDGVDEPTKLKIATARAARTSYLTMDGAIDVNKDVVLHDGLVAAGHWSPFEHPAVATPGSHGNFNGWHQYRRYFPNENRKCDLRKLLAEYEATLA
jgi:hypothetical protein